MNRPDQINEALSRCRRGEEITLELTDGTEVAGEFVSHADGEVEVDVGGETQRVTADDVSDVVVVISSDGPE